VAQPYAVALICAGLTLLAGSGERLNRIPDADALLVFFKEPFVIFSLICLGWFISTLRSNADSCEEFKSLIALPLSGRTLYDHHIYREWWNTLWVPACLSVVYAGLAQTAPWPYLVRLAMVSFFAHPLVLLVSHFAHLLLTMQRRGGGNFLFRAEPWIMAAATFLFLLCALAGLVRPPLISGFSFWLVLLAAGWAIIILQRINGRLFTAWLQSNSLFRTPMLKRRGYSMTASTLLMGLLPVNPWLWRNLIRGLRRRNRGFLAMTSVFILLSYLASMNNRIPADRAGVLLAISLGYTAVFAYQWLQRLTAAEESVQVLHALPVKTLSWFAGLTLPPMVWLILVYIVFTTLIAAYSTTLAIVFLLRSLLLGAWMLLMAAAAGLGAFPDVKKGQKTYLYLMLIATVLTALFYRFNLIIFTGLALTGLLRLRAVRYYRKMGPFERIEWNEINR